MKRGSFSFSGADLSFVDAHDSMLLLQKYTHPELQPLTVEGDAETPLCRKLQAFRLWFVRAPKGESGRVSEPLPARMSHDLWPSDQQWAEALPSILVIPAFYSQVAGVPELGCFGSESG